MPFHAPVSQQSAKTRRHSSTGLEFHDHQENTFTAPPLLRCPEKKVILSSFFFSQLCPGNSAINNLHNLQIYVAEYALTQRENAVLYFPKSPAIMANQTVQPRASHRINMHNMNEIRPYFEGGHVLRWLCGCMGGGGGGRW